MAKEGQYSGWSFFMRSREFRRNREILASQ
jgi:hypothetical protein